MLSILSKQARSNLSKSFIQQRHQQQIKYKSTTIDNSSLKSLKSQTSLNQSQGFKKTKRKLPKKDDQTLEDFILQNNVLSQYRIMLRSIHKIPDKPTQREVITFMKDEFRSSRNIKDKELKKSLQNNAMRKFRQLATQMQLALPDLKF
ncbi:unnamed protein product [Ambrosiozyma monospora]|uniref:Unnamed protein product n=1 Tax=Ambrosiozyma monospora TaxID=43982 RepID=A0ACB5TA18_AMBMO|nr:unnamed protein product [Ambrosiozyma monospora]